MAGANQILVFKDALMVLGTAATVAPALHRAEVCARYARNVPDSVPETIAASPQLAGPRLVGLGVPNGLAIASIHERREIVQRELQAAAGSAASLSEQIRRARRDRSTTW